MAQAYPTRPVRMIVALSGGFNDTTARLIDAWLSEHLGQQFVTKKGPGPGAGANLATEAVVRAAPDGYTLLTVSDANAYYATLYDNLRFNFIRDIAPNTPPEIIAILNTQVNAALADATFKARLVDLGLEPFANSPAEFGKFIVGYTEKWAKVIRAANIKPE